jgi:hypothetical protein
MWTSLIQAVVDCGLVFLAVLVLVFFLDRIGLILWLSWMSRGKDKTQASSPGPTGKHTSNSADGRTTADALVSTPGPK